MTDWFRSQIDGSATPLTRESLQRAMDRVWNATLQPSIIVVSQPVYRAYDFFLRRFNIWTSYSPRLILPAWMPHVAWSRPIKWAQRRYRRWKWAREERLGY